MMLKIFHIHLWIVQAHYVLFYTIGLNEIENSNPYGALLCSKHFLSFPLNEEDEEMMSFYKHELERQKF